MAIRRGILELLVQLSRRSAHSRLHPLYRNLTVPQQLFECNFSFARLQVGNPFDHAVNRCPPIGQPRQGSNYIVPHTRAFQ